MVAFDTLILLSKNGEKFEDSNTMILNISEFQCNTDRNADNYRGMSKFGDIDHKPPLQALISAYEDIYSLQLLIKRNTYKYSFRLDRDGRTDIKICECVKSGTQNEHSLTYDEATIDIYYVIIPLLKEQFNKDISNDWKKEVLPSMLKERAKSLIYTMLDETGLTLDDLLKDKNLKVNI